jgi:lipopolysaccharide/colanic/teichoic acid biosynthesis glycosyltransferase/acetyltransferase-like isoleucine patch superfamily enzyme
VGDGLEFTGDSQLIVLHKTADRLAGPFSFASTFANEPLGSIMVDALLSSGRPGTVCLAIPADWRLKAKASQQYMLCYDDVIPLKTEQCKNSNRSYLILSNGRFHTNAAYMWLRNVAASIDTDVVLANVDPLLSANQNKLRLTSHGQLAGVRRIYTNAAERASIPISWPCYVFMRKSVLRKIFRDNCIPSDFNDFVKMTSKDASIGSVNIGGTLLDIETPQGLLTFVSETIKLSHYDETVIGRNVRIGDKVRLIGPLVIGDNADIGDGAVVTRAVIGNDVKIEANEIVHDQVLIKSADTAETQQFKKQAFAVPDQSANSFKMWPRLSYARFVKRTADILAATAVLTLFAPVMAIIALIIKITSRGPVFFGHQRQGLHGKRFRCLKFRSMIVGADELQPKLRVKNEVDGPQFKMEDDPRVTRIGKFLRDTYLDEIPQFFNVLVGNMSVVGPRPSPEAENSLCAYWRDARLSVRPGITGLWQVCRTRRAGSDFQEWVHYDSQYVKRLSVRLDLQIFLGTAKYLISAFLRQF